MDKQDKWFIAGMIAVAVLITLAIGSWFDTRVDACSDRGGVLIKSASGWACADRNILLKKESQ